MSSWLVVWLIVALFTSGLLVIGTVALVRQGLVLGRTARRMRDELAPLTDAIAGESAHAGQRAAGLRMPERSRRRRKRG